MNSRGIFVLVLALALAFPAAQASAQSGSGSRVALIIGNAKYPDADAPLKEPIADARALADELKRDEFGFDVELAENLTKDGMLRALGRFYGKIKSGSVALVFFSGFAIQSVRQSFVIPVDGQVWTEADVRRDGVALETILKEMNSRGASVKVAILDASRRNPFERRFRPVSAGLAPVSAPTGSLVMYSGAPGTVISDADSEQRLFVGELLKELRTSGLSGEDVFNRTRLDVTRGSRGQQVPWLSSSLISDFSFSRSGSSGRPAIASAPSLPPLPPATTAPPLPPSSSSRPSSKPLALPKMDPVESLEAAPAPAPTTRPTNRPTPPSMPESAAIRDLNKKIDDNPRDVVSLYRRGQLFASNNDYSRAEQDFNELLRINPRDAEALNNRCWVRALLGELSSALKDCDEALKIRPGYADGLDSRGFVKLKIGMPRNAITDYDEALRLQSKKASSLYGRGIAKRQTGNTSGGNSDISAAKSIDSRIAEEFEGYGIRE